MMSFFFTSSLPLLVVGFFLFCCNFRMPYSTRELVSELKTTIIKCTDGNSYDVLSKQISELLNESRVYVDEKVIYHLFDEIKDETLSLDQQSLCFAILALVIHNTLSTHHTAEHEFSVLGSVDFFMCVFSAAVFLL